MIGDTTPSATAAAQDSILRAAQWRAYVPVGHRQVLQVIAASALSWVLLLGMAIDEGPASAHPYMIWRIYAGFAAAILTCAYVVHLRSRTAPLAVTAEVISWLDREVPRADVAARLLRWRHAVHDGTVLEIGDPSAPLRVGVSHRLAPPSLISALTLHGHVDAILSPPDFSDVLGAVGVARLEWSPPSRRGPVATWMIMLGIVSLLVLVIAFSGLGDRLTRSIGGRTALMTVMFCMFAVGGISTFTRGERSAATRTSYGTSQVPHGPSRRERPSTFWRTVGSALSLQVIIALVALVLVVIPIGVTSGAFTRWVDISACRAECSTLNLPFREYRARTKYSAGTCVCGERSLPRNYTVTGGTSIGARVLDWFVRTASMVVALFAGPFVLVGPSIVWKRLRRSRNAAAKGPS